MECTLQDAAQSLCTPFGKLCSKFHLPTLLSQAPQDADSGTEISMQEVYLGTALGSTPVEGKAGTGGEVKLQCSFGGGLSHHCSEIPHIWGQGPGLYTPVSICYWMPATLGKGRDLGSAVLFLGGSPQCWGRNPLHQRETWVGHASTPHSNLTKICRVTDGS